MTVAMLAMHGGLYLYLKTEGELRNRLRDAMWRAFGYFLVAYMLTTIYTVALVPHATANFERFPWEAAADIEFGKLDALEFLLPDKMKAIVITGKIFTLTWMLMGFQNFSLKLVLEPDLVGDVFRKVAEIQFSALDRILSKNYVGAIWAIDDLAFGSGPMISPEAYREHVFPWYREMAQRCHAKDRIYIMHSDGDLTKLMPDLIDVGIDVLQPGDVGQVFDRPLSGRLGDGPGTATVVHLAPDALPDLGALQAAARLGSRENALDIEAIHIRTGPETAPTLTIEGRLGIPATVPSGLPIDR